MIRTSFRLPIVTIRRLDAILAALRKHQVGNVTRADVVRKIIHNGLDREERQAQRRPRRRSPGR